MPQQQDYGTPTFMPYQGFTPNSQTAARRENLRRKAMQDAFKETMKSTANAPPLDAPVGAGEMSYTDENGNTITRQGWTDPRIVAATAAREKQAHSAAYDAGNRVDTDYLKAMSPWTVDAMNRGFAGDANSRMNNLSGANVGVMNSQAAMNNEMAGNIKAMTPEQVAALKEATDSTRAANERTRAMIPPDVAYRYDEGRKVKSEAGVNEAGAENTRSLTPYAGKLMEAQAKATTDTAGMNALKEIMQQRAAQMNDFIRMLNPMTSSAARIAKMNEAGLGGGTPVDEVKITDWIKMSPQQQEAAQKELMRRQKARMDAAQQKQQTASDSQRLGAALASTPATPQVPPQVPSQPTPQVPPTPVASAAPTQETDIWGRTKSGRMRGPAKRFRQE